MPDWLSLSLLAVEIIAGGLIVVYTYRVGISPMPSLRQARQEILRRVPVESDGPVVELGCGWGSLAIPLARLNPKRPVVAYELSPVPWLFTRLRRALSRTPNLELHRKDFFDASLREASVVVCYLYTGAMERLREKFEKELAPGTLVISNTFAIPSWSPELTLTTGTFWRTPIYFYRVT